MKNVSLHLCIPNFGGQIYTAFELCRANCERQGLFAGMSYVSDSLVSRARNVLTQRFLDSSHSHLFFIDSDIVFTPDDVRKIIAALEGGAQIVGGMYPLKEATLRWCLNEIPGEQERDDGLKRVKYIGTGFLAVERSVFYRMASAWPELAYHTDSNEGLTGVNGGSPRCCHDFWSVGVYRPPGVEGGTGRYLSEDWFFCQRAELLDIPVYAHTQVKLGHMGLIKYPLSP
jgi:hypothetical protein